MPTRWVGIDEAGYGPNLGPLVMTAVVVASPDDRSPDVWSDLSATVCRAGGAADKLWVDDSKRLYRAREGRDRLDAACLAVVEAAGAAPVTFGGLLEALGAGTLGDAELSPWLGAGEPDPRFPCAASRVRCAEAQARRPFTGAAWQVVTVRSVVIGPARFNAGLTRHGSKAGVHFDAFAQLLGPLWAGPPEGGVTRVRGDKHGGRHFYYDRLLDVFPDAWIDRGVEGPALSHYTVRAGDRRLELSLEPRADAGDGLVALASVVSKAVREAWMDVFNAYWCARVAGLRPTAGYPGDAARFRDAIAAQCLDRDMAPDLWWRSK